MKIIEATDEHLSQIEALYIQSVRANAKGFVQNLNFHGDIKKFAKQLQADQGLFAVGLDGDRVVAMGGLRRLPDNSEIVELCKLHVSVDYQGRGFGRALCQHFFDYAIKELDVKRIELHVTTSQCPAIKLYQTLGFNEDKTAIWETEFEQEKLTYETLFMSKDIRS